MSPVKPSILAMSVGAVSALAVVWGISTHRSASTEAEISPRVAQAGVCSFERGARASYRVETSSSLDMDLREVRGAIDTETKGGGKGAELGVAASPAQKRRREETWRLDTEVLEVSARGTILAARLVAEAGTKPRAADSGRTFLVRLREDCSIDDFARAKEATREGAHEQQALLSALNFTARSGVLRAEDGLGAYEAKFSRDGAQLQAQVLRYTRSFARGGGLLSMAPSLSVVSSSRAVTPARTGWFQKSAGAIRVMLMVQGKPGAQIGYTHRAEQVAMRGWAAGVSARRGAWIWGRVLDQPVKHSAPTWTVREELVGVSATIALRTVASMMNSREKGLMGYSGYLRDWIRANPGQLHLLKAWLLKPSTKETARLRSVLFMALGRANTPESRALLMAIMTDGKHSKADTSSAGLALVRSNPVPEGYLDALVAGSKDLERHGVMTSLLGMVAGEQARKNPEVAAAARAEIRKLLKTAESKSGTRQAIVAIGNAGDASMYSDLKPHIEGEDAELRDLAIRSLRRMPAETALPVVEQIIATNRDASARIGAYQVLKKQLARSPEVMTSSIRARLISDMNQVADPATRVMSVDILGRAAREGDAAAKAAIEEAFQKEMQKEKKDVNMLRKLGGHHNTTWSKGN